MKSKYTASLVAIHLLGLSGSLAAEEKPDFFANWAVGLAVVKTKVRSISDATIVNDMVRVNSEAKTEATLLVARHFYPWRKKDPGKCSDNENGAWYSSVGAMVSVGLR